MAPVDDTGGRRVGDERPDHEARDGLDIAYAHHRRIEEMVDIVRYCLEAISLEFDRWGEPHVSGPGFYLVVVSGTSVEEYADPMGANRWPVERCASVFGDIETFHTAAATTAERMDGAVVASIDGVLQERMVRLKDPSRQVLEERNDGPVAYGDWMGARHMSALDTSLRDDVVTAVTLSEEDGRVTVFTDGAFEDDNRTTLGGRWRAD
jgi:diadenylate cyclase